MIWALAYISKVIERIVASCLREHVDVNFLNVLLQSACKALHSTELALLNVQDDVLWARDRQKGVVLVLLDLFSPFDTVGHSILIYRLHKRLGLKGKALNWFKSYLTQRIQSVSVNASCPIKVEIPFSKLLSFHTSMDA